MWTRVKSLDQIRTQQVLVYDSEKDHKFDKNLRVIRKELEHNRGQFVFDPEQFKDIAKTFDVESYRLPEEGLKEYAKMATNLRKRFQQKADAANDLLQPSEGSDTNRQSFIVPELYRGCKKEHKVKQTS